MGGDSGSRALKQPLTMFLVVAGVSAGALGWLSWQLIGQDRDAAMQRRQDRLDQVADRTVATMQRALIDLQGAIGSESVRLPAGVTRLSIRPSSVHVEPADALVYLPVMPPPPVSPTLFAHGQRLEFIDRDFQGATREYARLASAREADTRAAALMRLARIARNAKAFDDALQAYDALSALDAVQVDGWPAGFVARLGRLSTFMEEGRSEPAEREAATLADELDRGRWPITKATYESAVAEIGKASKVSINPNPRAIARAEAASWLWHQRGEPSSRHLLSFSGEPVLVIWTTRPGEHDEVEATIADSSYLNTLAGTAVPADTRWSISDRDVMIGAPPPARGVASRSAVSAGLPWTVHVFPADPPPSSSPRPALVALVGIVLLVLTAGWYFIFRSLARERRVAELQSDFVAAVSHEFRSPLTTVGHAAELLAQGRLPSEDLKQQSYGILVRETARLRELVEGLLDFGRFGAHGTAFRFDQVDIDAIVRETVANFQALVAADGFHVELSGGDGGTRVYGDREALTRALWNLLDNAVKYSPECRTVWVDIERQADRVSISVLDRGLGIPADEQPVIFDRFVRGAASKSRRIRGTGIGLAMVRNIAQAHHGEVTVASVLGEGSRFTLTILTEAPA